jgi:hypothetical protein
MLGEIREHLARVRDLLLQLCDSVPRLIVQTEHVALHSLHAAAQSFELVEKRYV